MLRHACGYALANAGHDTRALQAWLGHKNIQHTVRYTSPDPSPLPPDFFRKGIFDREKNIVFSLNGANSTEGIFGNDASMNSIKTTAILVAMLPVLAAAATIGANVFAQEGKTPAKDYNQRALEIYEFRKAAASGPERGQEIFYYKCWFCHNEFVQGIPQLKGLYQNPNLLSGESVNDDTVKEKIRNGGTGMAAYKYTLSDADLNDLVSYLREKCCWDSDTPPLNPRYRMR